MMNDLMLIRDIYKMVDSSVIVVEVWGTLGKSQDGTTFRKPDHEKNDVKLFPVRAIGYL